MFPENTGFQLKIQVFSGKYRFWEIRIQVCGLRGWQVCKAGLEIQFLKGTEFKTIRQEHLKPLHVHLENAQH